MDAYTQHPELCSHIWNGIGVGGRGGQFEDGRSNETLGELMERLEGTSSAWDWPVEGVKDRMRQQEAMLRHPSVQGGAGVSLADRGVFWPSLGSFGPFYGVL